MMNDLAPGMMTELHDHGNGSYHTVHAGKTTQHPHLGHALMHIAKMHEPEADHVHAMGDDEGFTVHGVQAGGKVSGPHNPANIKALKASMGKFLDEEAQEHS